MPPGGSDGHLKNNKQNQRYFKKEGFALFFACNDRFWQFRIPPLDIWTGLCYGENAIID